MKNDEILILLGIRQSIDANDEITQMLELFDKDFKVDIIKMLKGKILDMFWIKIKIES